jgi:membrane-bound lytic murein transglycosylase D
MNKNWLLFFPLLISLVFSEKADATLAGLPPQSSPGQSSPISLLKKKLEARVQQTRHRAQPSLIFDIPVTYNEKVSFWIRQFQGQGQKWFRRWLERGTRYLPFIQEELRKADLPQDLAFMVMVESGFSATARSHAEAVGPWQFIEGTGSRYGLQKNSWLDERKDLRKSTRAAIRYIKDLYAEFGSWYLVAASYNMGESGLRKIINRHKTKDYWALVDKKALPAETREYVPKILAAMLITKAPGLYGFREFGIMQPLEYEFVNVPGGLSLRDLADQLNVTPRSLQDLNAELIQGAIPRQISKHTIRVPRGSSSLVMKYLESNPRKISVD